MDLRVRGKTIDWLFLVTVVIPTAIAILYFGFLASDVYVSESRFIVKSPDGQNTNALGMLFKGSSLSIGGEETFTANDYIVSRDALHSINRRGEFAAAYGGNGISIFDRFDPLGSSGSFEDLFEYFEKKVTVEHDAATNITHLTVRAYDADRARMFNERLLELAEATVNKLNARSRSDTIGYAQAEVARAKRAAQMAAVDLARYRNRNGIVDPEKQATSQLQLVSKMQDELIASRIRLVEIRRVAPQSPQIEVLEARIASLAGEVDAETGKVAGDRRSLAAATVQYQRFLLENEFAEKRLGAALASLGQAQEEARRKDSYIERVVEPNRPDIAIEPRRGRGILATILLGLVFWGILRMLFAGVREHVG